MRAFKGTLTLTVTTNGYTRTQDISCQPDQPLIEVIVP